MLKHKMGGVYTKSCRLDQMDTRLDPVLINMLGYQSERKPSMTETCPACECERRLDELKRNPGSPEVKARFAEVTTSYQDKLLPLLDLTALRTRGCRAHSRWKWDSFVDFVGRFNSQDTKNLLFGQHSSTPQ